MGQLLMAVIAIVAAAGVVAVYWMAAGSLE